ncbi:MAG: tetratricopeptide repeat protein [Elusimicrobia bacterium]|nr:tetratricopeptide repeat protein [Elusimicrobiota bacterium]
MSRAARAWGLCLIAAGLGCAGPRATGGMPLGELESAAQARLDAGDLRGGAALLRAAVERSEAELGPAHMRTLSLIGEEASARRGLGEVAETENILARLQARDAGTFEYFVTLGEVLLLVDRRAEAAAALKKAEALEPQAVEGYDRLAGVYRRMGLLTEAAQCLEKAGRRDLGDYSLLVKRSTSLYLLRRYDEAKKAAREAQALCPTCAEAYVQLGYAELDSGDDAAALRTFQKAQELAPEDPRSYHHLAYSYAVRGQNDKAAALYMRAIEVAERKSPPDYPHLLQAITHLSAVYTAEQRAGDQRRQGDLAALYVRSRAILEKIPDDPRFLNLAGMLALAVNKAADAEAYHRRALALLEKRPQSTELEEALAALAVLAERDGRHDVARALYERALAVGKGIPGNHQYLQTLTGAARFYQSQRRFEPAERCFQEAEALLGKTPADPQFRELLAAMAGFYRDWGRPAAARRLEERAAELGKVPSGLLKNPQDINSRMPSQ